MNDRSPGNWGLSATLKTIAGIMIIVLAAEAILYILEFYSLQALKTIVFKTLSLGGVLAIAGVLLGILLGGRK